MKKLILLLLLVVMPALAHAEDSDSDQAQARPYWSFEMKGGVFTPALPNFSQYYSKRDIDEYSMSLAYKIIRQVEIGVEGGYLSSHGQALAPIHNIASGSVTYDLYPANVFVLFRGVVNEQQWIVPYVGGGYTKMFYRESVEDQASVKGSANGYHARGGLQFLMDALDPQSANDLYMDSGIFHTYLFVEAEYIHAVAASTNLGGTSYLAGLLFEF